MKASDTVMPFSQIEAIDLKNAESNFTDALYDVAREQAEISFKAGIEEAQNRLRSQEVLRITKEALAEQGLDGIKEVVEWISEHSQLEQCDPDVMQYFTTYRWVDEYGWQSKLKEWGIE